MAHTNPQPKLKPGMVVVKEIRADAEGGIVSTLQRLMGEVFTSDTSAKKGCRRKEVLLDGTPATTTSVTNASEKQDVTDSPSKAREQEPSAVTQGSAGSSPGKSGGVNEDDSDSIREGLIDHNVQGKAAQTRFRVMQVTPSRAHGHLTTLWLHPLTGRKHQLRRHCVDVLGCAILGDARYRGTRAKRGREHYLKLSESSHGHTLISVVDNGGGPSAPKQAAAEAAQPRGAAAEPAEGAVSEPHTLADEGAGECSTDRQRDQQKAGVGGGSSQAGGNVSTLGDCVGSRDGGQGQMGFSSHSMDISEGQGRAAHGDGTDMQEIGGVAGGLEGGEQAKLELEGLDGGEAEEGEEEEEELTMLADGTHLCLCAAELEFKHPITGQDLHFEMPEPDYFEAARKAAMQ
ncbi:hypothetical protein DUNSADRAFT_9985 [Dunaliella salina]|uniref:Pseudouridine synthase RsuA/RluA-like domain-containing protein n=1 Tax=Dunaliella salina TaxID=3046 RepID=A0ABQ7GGB3_DUNSA|nr:hypothetical protein DUNSADRAFT_9985 [Dunaliella salina]|eukprot:KAF5833642.1 hypothetical protein DUNSADRAFT_9985 [Dunaliella salina]